jgi:hypothetical protein
MTDPTVHFGLVELDLLATHAGVPFPYPLRVPSFGRVTDERDTLLADAGYALMARGLADEHGPLGAAADLVTALREHRGAVDLVVVGDGTTTGVVAMVHRTWAVVCGQVFGTATVQVRRVARAALTDALADAAPVVPAAPTLPITLPPGVVPEALRLLGDTDATDARHRLRDLVRHHGGDPDVVDRLTELLPTVAGRGQLGATRRGGGRAGPELSWLDSPRGRVRVDHADDGWTSVNPLRHNEFLQSVGAAVTIAREPW